MFKYDPEMHRTLCSFMRLELEFFLKFKNFYDRQRGCNASERSAIAQALKDEYPLAMFNEVLMEFFDAYMARSEGFVKNATDMTKGKYEQILRWHSMLSKETSI